MEHKDPRAAKPVEVRKVTYFGRRAEVRTVYEAGKNGPRWVFTTWIDSADLRNGGHPAGTTTARKITGDPARGTGQTLVETHVIGELPPSAR